MQTHCRQHCHAQRKGKDPTEGAVELIPSWQAIIEQRIERRAKGKEQGEQRQPHTKPDDPGA